MEKKVGGSVCFDLQDNVSPKIYIYICLFLHLYFCLDEPDSSELVENAEMLSTRGEADQFSHRRWRSCPAAHFHLLYYGSCSDQAAGGQSWLAQ